MTVTNLEENFQINNKADNRNVVTNWILRAGRHNVGENCEKDTTGIEFIYCETFEERKFAFRNKTGLLIKSKKIEQNNYLKHSLSEGDNVSFFWSTIKYAKSRSKEDNFKRL